MTFARENVNNYLKGKLNFDQEQETVNNGQEFKKSLINEISAVEKRYGRPIIKRQEPPRRQFLITLLLSIFLGTLGADWFYLALGNNTYIMLGVLKLLLNFVGIGQIWWIIDWI